MKRQNGSRVVVLTIRFTLNNKMRLLMRPHFAYNVSMKNKKERSKMKVLLVNGGPHKTGCTYTALCEVAETLNKEGIETFRPVTGIWYTAPPRNRSGRMRKGCIPCECWEEIWLIR